MRELRAKVANKLNIIRDVSMFDFVRMEKDPGMVKHCTNTIMDEAKRAAAIAALPVLPYLDLTKIAALDPDEQREILSAVKSVTHTEHGPKFEIHSPLEAIAQLRKMSGLDEPDKSDVSMTAMGMIKVITGIARAPDEPVGEIIKQEAAE